ncbi:hypothetical protein C2845_PM11G29910 [Panicum miliaceum]|uniref:Protein REVEILLE 1-like n=1 Tax=Panicum miliaceum TaxID=4540 RepID=A0A3L6RTR4_PANMI|nr:hypothetical protein C2845_PM11G29910 [Panicum miliaceum]
MVVRESSGSSTAAGAAPAIQIPPPRPKRKPAHPYPRKVDGAAKKHVPALRQLEKPPLRTHSLRDQGDGSPTSVLTTVRTVLRAEELGSVFANSSSGSRSLAQSAAGSDEHGNGGGSPASTVDKEDGGVSPSVANAKVFGDAKEASCVGTEVPVFKLFGKKVVVKDSYGHPQSGRDLKIGASPAIVASGGSSWNPWPDSMQQLMCFVPQPAGFAAQSVLPWLAYNGSLPCALLYPQAAPSAQRHHQTSEPPDRKRTQREGSLTGSNTASSAVPAAQTSDAAESRGPGQGTTSESDAVPPAAAAVPVPRLARCASSASFSRRGFVPYKRCAAESEAPRPVAAGEEADGELTRLCL